MVSRPGNPAAEGAGIKMQTRVFIRPIELADANTFVGLHHRHHKPVVGHKFSIAAIANAEIVGVAIIGRPVARLENFKTTLEVTRLCTNGHPNACSALYAAAARIGKEMGYCKIQTFILDTESGISLKASGWELDRLTRGGQWKHTDGKPRRTDQPTCKKYKWYRHLNEEIVMRDELDRLGVDPQLSLV